MKHTLAKGMGLALAAALTLTGCNLIEVDEVMQANEDIAKVQKNYSKAVATYDGGEVTVDEAIADFNSQYQNMYYMYYYYLGTSLTEDQIQDIAEDVLEAKVEEEIVAAKFDADGHTLTDDQMTEVQTSADEDYTTIHDEAMEEATGKDDEAKEANAQLLLTKVGQTKDQIYAEALQAEKATQEKQILLDEVTEVTDEELQTAYDELLASNKETYDADPAQYGTDVTSGDSVIAYVPEGYRTVRHILVKPEDSVLTAYTDAKSALETANSDLATLQSNKDDADANEGKTEEEINAEIAEAQAKVDSCTADVETARQACLDNVSAKTTEIYEKLSAGTAFADVMAEYGEDPGMQDEETAKTGYYVCATSTNWQTEFTEGAMALANVGDYSAEPVVSGSGVHIIEYYSDVKAGEIALADIHDALQAQTLETKQTTHRDETVAGWIEAANPTYDAAALVTAATAE